MNFRTGVAAGADGAVAVLSVRRLGRRALGGIVRRLERRLERAVRDLTAKAEHGGPLVKAALVGAKALAAGKSPVRALLSFGWTALKETLAKIFGRGRGGEADQHRRTDRRGGAAPALPGVPLLHEEGGESTRCRTRS